jgi:DNA-binding MarR family transcriptional regulator
MTAPSNRNLAERLSRADQYVAQRFSAVLHTEGLTLEQWRVLDVLADGHGHTMSAIAEQAMLAPATLTRLIDRLVEASVLYRQIDPIDRRRILVFLATRGSALRDRVAGVVDGEEEALAAALGEERAQLLGDLLRQLADLG